jgi:RHS repeat-associated protein
LVTHYEYDALGRQTKVSLPPAEIGDPRPETLFTYDELGSLLNQTDANGHVTGSVYDLAGNRRSQVLPGLQTETFVYDGARRVLSHTDFNGETSTFAYDPLSRRTRIDYEGGSSVVTTYAKGGQRLTVTDSRGTTSYVYDERDRLTSRTDPDGLKVEYGYTPTGKVESVTTPAGPTIYGYDAIDRLASVTDPDGRMATYAYDAVGNLVEIEHANGTRTQYVYNARNQLTTVEQWGTGGVLFAKHVYTLDPNGLRTRVDELPLGSAVTYVYDGNYRLVRETRLGVNAFDTAYVYDAVGNRTVMNRNGVVTNYVYDANDRLVSAGTSGYAYDDNGNLTGLSVGGQTTAFVYDGANRLVRSTTGGAVTDYEYDADGNRVLKSDAAGDVRYVLDTRNNTGVAQVLEERRAGSLLARYTYGLARLSQNRGGLVSHYHTDGLGSVRALTDVFAAVTDTYVYDAYGNQVAATGTTENPYRFAGEPFDPNVGFYYLRARYYDPATGRFVSMDPAAGDPQSPLSLHRYLYANDNPVNFVDPTGRFTLIEVNVSLSIQSTIRSIYTKNLVKFFFSAAKIAFCTIEPAYRMQDLGLDMMFKGLPGGELLIQQGRDQIAAGYKAIGQAAAQVYEDTLNDVIQFEVEFDGVLADIYDWADGEGDIPSFVPIPDEVAEMIEFYEELNGWLDSFRGAYETAKQGFEAASSGDPCLIFTFIEENADTIIDLIPDF